jgi:hypothetical protein
MDGIQAEASEFLRKHGLADITRESLRLEAMRRALMLAEDTVLLYAPEFVTDDLVLAPPAATDKSAEEIKLWWEAASFLLVCEIADIDDGLETDIIYQRILRFPDKSINKMAIMNAKKARTVTDQDDIAAYLARISSAAAVQSKSKHGVDSTDSTLPVPNKEKMSAERVRTASEVIVSETRREYVKDFRHCFRKWDANDNYLARFNPTSSESRMRSTLEMCRVVYEAQRNLSEQEFEDFCKEIDLTKRSAIRKFIAFGESYPSIMQYMKSVEPPQWFVVDYYLRLPSGRFQPSDEFAEMWATAVTNARSENQAAQLFGFSGDSTC